MNLEEVENLIENISKSVTQRIKEIIPKIKQNVAQISNIAKKTIEKIDFKNFSDKVSKIVKSAKQKIDSINKNNEIEIKVNNIDAEKQIGQIEKLITTLEKKILSRQIKLNVIDSKMENIRNKVEPNIENNGIELDSESKEKAIDDELSSNKEYKFLKNQSVKFHMETDLFKSQVTEAEKSISKLKKEIGSTSNSQNKLNNFFNNFKSKYSNIDTSKFKTSMSAFSQLTMKSASKIMSSIKGFGSGLVSGITNVIKFAKELFSIQKIYNVLKNCANSWLSSQNEDAKQLSSNIEYMKYSMGGVFAPVIEYIVNLVYELMKAIQLVVYKFSGINIFAKSTATSMGKTASKAEQASKSLSGVHNEINNLSSSDGGNSSDIVTPNIDLSNMNNEMNLFTQKLYDFFKPLKESWDNYSSSLINQTKNTINQISNLFSTMWSSVENIIANGRIYEIFENILKVIGNVSEALKNAWNYNSNGNAIIQNISNAFNNLFSDINEIAESDEFQNWLFDCSDKFREITEKIDGINWQPLIEMFMIIGEVGIDILDKIIEAFKWIIENPTIAEIILAIAATIGILGTAIGVISSAIGILNPIVQVTSISMSELIIPILAVIAAIVVLIGVIMLAPKIFEWLSQKVTEIFSYIANFISQTVEGIKNSIISVWNGICNFISELWNSIVQLAIITFTKIRDTISNVLNTVKSIWNSVWISLSNTISNIWNGMWNTIKKIINWILGGIETFVNGIIRGINKVINALDGVVTAVGSVIGIDIHVNKIGEISLPRLAKGNVAYGPMVAQFGEYIGASTNPEITAPQNILRETFDQVLANHEWNNQNNTNMQLAVYVGNKKLGEILIDNLRDIRRQTGKNLEVIVGG